jgi:EPS-associated MarR family transcriptional regulator
MSDQSISYHLLKTLEKTPDLSQRALANRLGVSLGKVNFCLNALVEKGFLKVKNFRNSENKLAYAYLLTPQGVDQKARMTVDFLQIKLREYECLRSEIEELEREALQQRILDNQRK